jgi:hypothetical protein
VINNLAAKTIRFLGTGLADQFFLLRVGQQGASARKNLLLVSWDFFD